MKRFYVEGKKMHKFRFDAKKCMRRYVLLTINGKIPY